MADSNLNLSVTLTGADQAVAATQTLSAGVRKVKIAVDEHTEALKKHDAARKKEIEYQQWWSNQLGKQEAAQKKVTESQEKANAALNKSQTATGNSAMGLLFLSQAIEDVQYGFGAVLNNIPLIIMSMGGSAGLAGAASIAAVGLYQVGKNMDLFGTQAKEAAKSASELAEQKTRTAESSKKLLAAQQAELAALREIEQYLTTVNRRYEENIALIQQAADEKQRAADRDAGIYDESANLALAEIQLRKTRGDITQEQADAETAQLRIAAIERKKADEELKARIEIEKQAATATEARTKAQQAYAKASELDVKSAGLLTEKERELLKQQKSAAFQQSVNLEAEKQAFEPSSWDKLKGGFGAAGLWITTPGGVTPEIMAKAEADYQQNRMAFLNKEQARLRELQIEADRKLQEDKAARERTGVSDAEKLQEQVNAAKQAEADALKTEAKAKQDISRVNEDIAAKKQILDTQAATIRVNTQIQALELQKQRQEEALRAQQKAQQEQDDAARLAERFSDQGRGLLQFARNVADGDAGTGRIIAGQRTRANDNAIDGSVRALAAEAARAGADGFSEAELNALLKQTSESMRRLVNVNHATKKFMEDMNEKIQEMLATHNNNRR